MAIVNHRLDAVARQHVRAGEARRTRADNRHALAGRFHVRHIWTPAHLHRFIVDVALDIADGDRTELVVQGAGAFAQAILRANASAHFRQAVGLMRQLRRFDNAAFVRQLQPVRNVVVNRTLPLAVRVAARETAIGLRLHLAVRKGLINFDKLNFTNFQRLLWRVNALQVDKLIYVLTHRNLLRLSRPARRTGQTITVPARAALLRNDCGDPATL